MSLSKGGNVSLTKAAPNLAAIAVGLGWDVRSTAGDDFDLDASALALSDNHKILSDEWFVFFNNLKSPDGSIEHQGDKLTGEGEGDDEVINIDLKAVPPQAVSIVVT
ncbi:MAG TPA: TerD family protein, partial [Nakamurella sp.]